MYSIEIYEREDGTSEIISYFQKLQKSYSKSDRIKVNKIRMYMRLLEEYGLELKEPYIKKIDDEIWEIRPIRDRILFASWYNNIFVLLSVFMKDTRKTPKKEIEKAKRLFEDYKKRRENNE